MTGKQISKNSYFWVTGLFERWLKMACTSPHTANERMQSSWVNSHIFKWTNYSYSFDGEEFCANGIKNNFAIDKFFFNSNGLTCDVTANIYGPEINYSIVFPNTYSSSSLTGVFANSSSFAVKIFSAEITNGNSSYYSTSSINNISIAANSSGNIILTDLYNQTGIYQTFTLTLYTNFGIVNTVVNASRIWA